MNFAGMKKPEFKVEKLLPMQRLMYEDMPKFYDKWSNSIQKRMMLIMFLSEYHHYILHGDGITGGRWEKWPVPVNVDALPFVSDPQQLKNADLSLLTTDEKSSIMWVVDKAHSIETTELWYDIMQMKAVTACGLYQQIPYHMFIIGFDPRWPSNVVPHWGDKRGDWH